jgi:hypothetical protein
MKKRIFKFFRVVADFNFPLKPETTRDFETITYETAELKEGDIIVVDLIAKQVWVPIGKDEFAEALTSVEFIEINSDEKGGKVFSKTYSK